MSDCPESEMSDGDDRAAFDDWDEQDWSKVDEVQAQIDEIEAIEDPAERKAAAKAWAAKLAGGQ
jgi:hypothetical protein